MTLRWSHAVIYVRNLDAMLAFYGEVLGFQVTDRGPLDPNNPDLQLAFISQSETDHHQLAFVPVRGEGPSTSLDHMAFRVESLSEVKAMVRRLEADDRVSNVRLLSHGNTWSVYFQDPEENGLEVFCDTPFHVRQPQGQPWELSMSDDELRDQVRERFRDEPDFGPMDEFYAAHRRRLEQP